MRRRRKRQSYGLRTLALLKTWFRNLPSPVATVPEVRYSGGLFHQNGFPLIAGFLRPFSSAASGPSWWVGKVPPLRRLCRIAIRSFHSPHITEILIPFPAVRTPKPKILPRHKKTSLEINTPSAPSSSTLHYSISAGNRKWQHSPKKPCHHGGMLLRGQWEPSLPIHAFIHLTCEPPKPHLQTLTL